MIFIQVKIKLDSLTGIRFFAAAFIVIGHAHATFGSAGIATTFALNQGVSIFFILSGFILAYSYPMLTSKEAIAKFLLARFARIWPLHIVTILLLLLLIPPATGGYIDKQYLYIIALGNLFLIQSWNSIKNIILSLNGVAWSISTEFFFYLCFPALIWGWRNNWIIKILIMLLFVISFVAIGNYLNLSNDDNFVGTSLFGVVYTNPLVRIFEFVVGIATYFLYKKLNPIMEKMTLSEATFLEITSVFFVLISMWLTPAIAYSPTVQKVIGAAGGRWIAGSGSFLPVACMILLLAYNKGYISRFLGKAFMVWLGEISFAIYLSHTIILKYINNNPMIFRDMPLSMTYVVFWSLVILISHLLFKVVEQPCRRYIVQIPEYLKSGLKVDGIKVSLSKEYIKKTGFYYGVIFFAIILGMKFILPNSLGTVKTLPAEMAVTQIANSKWHEQDEAVFGDGFVLKAVNIKKINESTSELELLWQAKKDVQLKYRVGVHFLLNNNILDQKDYVQSSSQEFIKSGIVWKDSLIIKNNSLKGAKDIGLAIYERPDALQYLLPVTSKNTDWGGRRLIIKDVI